MVNGGKGLDQLVRVFVARIHDEIPVCGVKIAAEVKAGIITGIATVYELQLRNISKQVSTIEQIDEQTRRMAQQIEELNNVYARMINALTINMNGVAGTPANEK